MTFVLAGPENPSARALSDQFNKIKRRVGGGRAGTRTPSKPAARSRFLSSALSAAPITPSSTTASKNVTSPDDQEDANGDDGTDSNASVIASKQTRIFKAHSCRKKHKVTTPSVSSSSDEAELSEGSTSNESVAANPSKCTSRTRLPRRSKSATPAKRYQVDADDEAAREKYTDESDQEYYADATDETPSSKKRKRND